MKLSSRFPDSPRYALCSHRKYVAPLLVFIFLFTLGLRFAFIAESESIPVIRTPTPGMDIDLHWQAAHLLNEGATMDAPCFELMLCSTPLHQFWHAFWLPLLGDSMRAHRMLNACLGAINALMLFSLIYRLKSSLKIAFACTIAWAMLPSLIYFDSTLHKSTLEIFVLLLLLLLLLKGARLSNTLACCLHGALLGLLSIMLILLQGNSFLYILVVLAFVLFATEIPLGKRLLTGAAATLLFLVLLSIYSFLRPADSSRYSWFLPQKGVHFCIGLQENGDGTYQALEKIKPWPHGHLFQGRLGAEVAVDKPLSWSEADRYYMDRGLRFIVDHPGRTMELALAKALLFFNNYEVKGVDDLNYLETRSRILGASPMGLGIILIFAGLGTIRLFQLKAYRLCFLLLGFLLAILIGNCLGFVSSRYRLHGVVPLTILSAFGIEYLMNTTKDLFSSTLPKTQRLRCCLQGIVLPVSLLVWFAYHPVLQDKAQNFQKQAAINNKLSIEAEKLQHRLADLEKNPSDEQEYVEEKVHLLVSLHRHTQAFNLLENIHQDSIYSAFMLRNHLTYLIWLGEYGLAGDLLKRVPQSRSRLIAQAVKGLGEPERAAYTRFVQHPVVMRHHRLRHPPSVEDKEKWPHRKSAI